VIVCEVHSQAARTAVEAILSGYRIEEIGGPWRILAMPVDPSS
jgi:hypothetical protein